MSELLQVGGPVVFDGHNDVLLRLLRSGENDRTTRNTTGTKNNKDEPQSYEAHATPTAKHSYTAQYGIFTLRPSVDTR